MAENPYRLARDIRGIGFKSADTIAMRLGIENPPIRPLAQMRRVTPSDGHQFESPPLHPQALSVSYC
jgi:hypothetical protein